jgi:hypothetical protein
VARRCRSAVVRGDLVRLVRRSGARVCVHQGRGQPEDVVQQPVFGLVGDPMRVDQREARVETRSRGRLDLVARSLDGVGTGHGVVISSSAS